MTDVNALLKQLDQTDKAYQNASAAKSPDAVELAAQARSLAAQIAAAQQAPPPPPPPPPPPKEPPPPEQPGFARQALGAYGNAVGAAVEPMLSMASGAVMNPVSGIVGLGAAALKGGMNLVGAHHAADQIDPAAVVHGVQDFGTYKPQTEGGKDVLGTIGDIAGYVPKVADAAGQDVTDYTHSPLLGTIANTGIQGMGMLLGGELGPMASSVNRLKPVRATTDFVRDIIPGKTTQTADRLYQNAAAGKDGAGLPAAISNLKAHNDAERQLIQAGQSGDLAGKYGIRPTSAGVAKSTGLAQMERTLRNQGENAQTFGDVDKGNLNAVHGILQRISGTAQERLRAGADRDDAAATMYDDALNNPVHAVPMPEWWMKHIDEVAPSATGPTVGLNDLGARLQEVSERPAMLDALKKASITARNRGVKIDNTNLMQQLHWAKVHLDNQIKAGGADVDLPGLLDTKHTLLDVMDDLSPAYEQARKNYQAASRPINRMDIGEALRQKYLTAKNEATGTGSSPASLLTALRKNDGDTIAQSATGFRGATLDNTLHPDDLRSLDVAREQLGREGFAQDAGRGFGSPTAANQVSQRALDDVGSLHGVLGEGAHAGHIGALLTHPHIAVPASILGAWARAGTKAKLTNYAIDPGMAQAALERRYLRAADIMPSTEGAALQVGANDIAAQQPDEAPPQDHAAGGPVNFWDLVKRPTT